MVQIWPGLICVYTSRTAQQLCDLERVKPQPPPSFLLGLEPVQSCLGVARVMSNYGYKKKYQSRSYLNHPVYLQFYLTLMQCACQFWMNSLHFPALELDDIYICLFFASPGLEMEQCAYSLTTASVQFPMRLLYIVLFCPGSYWLCVWWRTPSCCRPVVLLLCRK